MEWLKWLIRAVIILAGIVLAVIVWKGKREGRHQEYSLRFFVIGITAFILGAMLLIVSYVTVLQFDYDLFLIAAGAICIIIGMVIRNTREKNR